MTSRKGYFVPSLEVLEDRLAPSWSGMPPSTITPPASAAQITANSSGDAQGVASIAYAEVDYYSFVAPVSGTYVIEATTPSSNVNTVLGVFGSTGSRLAYNNDISNLNTNSRVTISLTAGQLYYIGITNYTGTTAGSYSWSIDGPAVSVVDDAYEENDSLAAAYNLGTLTSAKTISGLTLQDSADWFKFTITSTGTSSNNVTISFLNSQGNIDLQLYNSAGTLLKTSKTTGNSELISLNGLVAGTYYVKVYGYNGAKNPSYSLTVNPPLGNTIPALNSLPGAAKTLYLDFDGFYEANWGSYQPGTTPAFDQDGNPNAFSSAELVAIQQIWAQVAEDFAPFNVNVTTVEPSSFADGVALRVVIGGNGSWINPNAGGVGYLDSFTNSLPNSVYVFSVNLGNGYAKYVADAVSHEAAHGFGLEHQSQYAANGNMLAEYYAGPGDGRAPIMGYSYYAARSLWWYGTSAEGPTSIQDDMAALAAMLGYRADDHGNSSSAATALAGSTFNGSGIITQMSDLDYFAFTTGGGTISASVSILTGINNLDAVLERDAQGNLIVRSDPGTSFGASLTATLSAGTYYLVVASHGGYGDVGQYTLNGTVA